MYLNCHTYYSLRFGTISEVELLELAKKNQIDHLALTDINNTSAGLNFVRKAQEIGIKPILGINFRNGSDPCFVGLAKNNEGYHELNNYLSHHLHHGKRIGSRAPVFNDAFVIYPFKKVLLNKLEHLLEHEFIGISIKDLRRLPFSQIMSHKDKLVVQQAVTFRNKRDFNAHRLLRAIDNNILLSKLPKTEEADLEEKMLPLDELLSAFSQHKFILENTERLMRSCNIFFDFSDGRKPQNLVTYLGDTKKDEALLEELCQKGLPLRYKHTKIDSVILERLKKELDLIKKMGFVSYFLINYDIIQYAIKNEYPYICLLYTSPSPRD